MHLFLFLYTLGEPLCFHVLSLSLEELFTLDFSTLELLYTSFFLKQLFTLVLFYAYLMPSYCAFILEAVFIFQYVYISIPCSLSYALSSHYAGLYPHSDMRYTPDFSIFIPSTILFAFISYLHYAAQLYILSFCVFVVFIL